MKRIMLALAFLAAVLGCTNCSTGKSTPVAGPLQKRINSKHGTHIVDYAASLGLGSLNYEVVDIDGV